MTTKKKAIHNNIAKLRKAKGYTQVGFAEAVNITHWWLNDIENGREQPGLNLSLRIADKLGVTLNDLFLK